MKPLVPLVFHSAFFALLGLVLSPLAVAHALSPPADSVHFYAPFDYEQWRRDRPRPAAKRLANLDVGPPRTVRLIYFLPNDRPYRAEVVNSMKTMARRLQTFYGEQMQAHGYGDRAFRLETDAAGSPKVHRVDGRHSDSHYLDHTLNTVQEELRQAFDLWSNIYIVVIDNSIHGIGFWGRLAAGVGIQNGKNGGVGLFSEEFGFTTIAHELGHTFGLEHDFRDDAYIMSYGPGEDRLSACTAEFLAVHPYFNHAIPTSETQRPTIELISPRYPAGSNSASVQLRVRDSDGLHQVTLFARTRNPHFSAGFPEVKACRGLAGEKEAVVKFDYDGVIPSAPLTTSLSMSPVHFIMIKAVDTGGSVGYEEFILAEISPHHIATLEGHGGRGYAVKVSFSPDGATLAAGSGTKIRLWDVATKTNVATFAARGAVYSVAFSPDGETLASGATDDAVQLWDVSEWTESRPHSLVATSGDGQEGPASTQLAKPLVVSVLDQYGSPLAGVDVIFSVTAGGGTLSSTTDTNPCTIEESTSSITSTTDANGQATTRLTLGSQPETNTVEATIGGLEPEPFTATATEQARPHSLTKVCGDDQEGTAITLLEEPLVVSVSDEDGAALAGVIVSFAVTAGGGLLSAPTATTDANGRAETRLRLGIEAGTNAVAATVAGLEPVTFTATAQESPFASLFDLFKSGKRVALPDRPQLAQNAPNPFNSQTVLSYFLPAPGLARVEVFALTGQRVAVLHQGPQEAGYHRLYWAGRDDAGRLVASGLYLYRLVTDEAVLTRKLTLLR